jgi:hypothetical protein
MVCEYHPFRRVWRESRDLLTVEYPCLPEPVLPEE